MAAELVPAFAPEPAACIMVGMGGFFAGVAKVPFASVIMVMEMTGSYGLLVPSLLVAAIAYLAIPPAARLYENQVANRSESPAHLGSFAVDILRLARVGNTWDPVPLGVPGVRQDATLGQLMEMASESGQSLFPVVDDAGALVGEVSIEDIRRALISEAPRELVVVYDLMRQVVGPLVPQDDLTKAARLLAGRQADAVLVVDSPEAGKVLGIFSRRDLIVGYGKQLAKLRGEG